MSLRLWQWIVVAALVVAFVVGAALLAADGSDRRDDAVIPEFNEVAWCQAAAAVQANSGLLGRPGAQTDTDDLLNLRISLEEAQFIAPAEIQSGIARLLDLVRLTTEQVEEGTSVRDGFVAARSLTDRARVDAAIADLDEAVTDCGHPPLG